MPEPINGRFWRGEKDAEGILWLHFDTPDSSTNLLSVAAITELETHLIAVGTEHPAGVIILSDKPGGFIAGADVREFQQLDSQASAARQIRHTHAVFHRLESLSVPTLALIHGYCLGGGLELALACRYRVARDDEATRLGFPEVRLGLFPGYGGTVRACRVIGSIAAMQMMLSGRSVGGRAASRLGLVDLAVPERQLKRAARDLIVNRPAARRAGWWKRLPELAPLRPLAARLMGRELARRADPDHYPAPYALVDHWRHFACRDEAMYANEARAVARLITDQTARNLIRVFFLQERLKGLGRKEDFVPRRVHVIGGGVMGGDIAAWCALRGLRVSLQDRAPEYLGRAVQRAHALFRKKLKRPRPVQAAFDRLMPDPKGYGVGRADVVIEAIFEDVAAKQALFRDIEARIHPDALLATNTSSIPLEELGQALESPQRLIGLHFFNPVAKMQLVEIVTTEATDPETARRAAAFTRQIDRLPLPVKSSPGFLVNRVLMPYLLEAVTLLEEGVPAPVIDRAATDFGMPMGPIELADTVGLDICLSVGRELSRHLAVDIPSALEKCVAAGHLGRKSGQGFYRHAGGKSLKERPARDYHAPEDLSQRLILRLVNEAVACLREGVVSDPDLIDAGLVFGTGFAPFRGGPMHYVQASGVDSVQTALHDLEKDHGGHFAADAGWATLSL